MQYLALSESIKVSYDMSNAASPKPKSLPVPKLISSASAFSICSFHLLIGLDSIPHTSSLRRLHHHPQFQLSLPCALLSLPPPSPL